MKIKRKHRPMTIAEWAQSLGAEVAVNTIDVDSRERLLDSATPDHRQAFQVVSAAYDAYITAHIEYLLEKKR